eukprot:CAMPEP_0171186596 /NCGR_PEP_ID=MMETSP0790-20130122/16894_1 /TAXON_ID=2925 /ORGANISM="Alexandrium catenella, Strain OF101" /LENGTH=71 /DNA_ID=CAMNT_0011651645 /DNA_START=161 /DNA_END=376 /DNA_ORIENTATION=-
MQPSGLVPPALASRNSREEAGECALKLAAARPSPARRRRHARESPRRASAAQSGEAALLARSGCGVSGAPP